MTPPPRPGSAAAEARARGGYVLINAVRLSGIGLIMCGFAIARGVIDLPWIAGAVLAVAGLITFFFLPRFAARAWKSRDNTRR